MIEPQVYAVQKDIKLALKQGGLGMQRGSWVTLVPCPLLSTFAHFHPIQFSLYSILTVALLQSTYRYTVPPGSDRLSPQTRAGDRPGSIPERFMKRFHFFATCV